VVATPITINSRGLEGSARPAGRRRFARAVGIALGMVALGTIAAFSVGVLQDQPWTAAAPSAGVLLPGDLFAAPPVPKPRIVVRYLPSRATSSAPAAPMASATPSRHPRPSPSPSPGGGDD
jgi:hypothetical protein